MAGTNTFALVAGGLVVVALSFGAGLLGASTVAPDTAAPPPRSLPDSAVRSRLDEMERRIGNLEQHLKQVEDTADEALAKAGQIDVLRRIVDELRGSGTVAAAPTVEPAQPETMIAAGSDAIPLTEEEIAAREQERIEKLKADMRKIVFAQAPGLMKHRLAAIANTTAQGEADRRSQIYADSKRMATQYQLTPAEETRLREIYITESQEAVRDVAPLLSSGLDKADYAAVKEKLGEVWDRRDEKMAEVLDTEQLDEYRETQKEWRKVYEKVLDDMGAERSTR